MIYHSDAATLFNYIYCMNPEISPWMVIADKQRYNDFKREQEEK